MIRAFELRLKPTAVQCAAFEAILRDSCETYNAALQERIEAWKLARKSVTLYDQFRELTELHKDPQFAIIAADIQREPLRRLDRAFKGFYRRCRSGEKPGFPRFRSRNRYNSFAWHEPRLHGDAVLVPNLGHVKFKTHQEIKGTPKQIIIKRLGKKWVGRLVCDIGPAPAKGSIRSVIGVDMGLTMFAALSDGTEIQNPHFVHKHTQRIMRAQKNLARKLRDSKNRLRAKEQIRRAYQRIADARKNFCHHVSKELVSRYDLIAHEDLEIQRMAKGTFAKSIMDTAWGILLHQLAYKAEEAGRYVIAVDPRGTSQRCSGCGVVVKKDLAERHHTCACGTVLGRDHNAALNILALGRSAVGLVPSEGLKLTYYPELG